LPFASVAVVLDSVADVTLTLRPVADNSDASAATAAQPAAASGLLKSGGCAGAGAGAGGAAGAGAGAGAAAIGNENPLPPPPQPVTAAADRAPAIKTFNVAWDPMMSPVVNYSSKRFLALLATFRLLHQHRKRQRAKRRIVI
jgi:hypothetical protein